LITELDKTPRPEANRPRALAALGDCFVMCLARHMNDHAIIAIKGLVQAQNYFEVPLLKPDTDFSSWRQAIIVGEIDDVEFSKAVLRFLELGHQVFATCSKLDVGDSHHMLSFMRLHQAGATVITTDSLLAELTT